MIREAAPLRDYLEPAASLFNPFCLQNMRPRWRNWTVFDCNWKVALEAFNETYHMPGNHPEFTAFGDFTGRGRPQGKHSHIGYDANTGVDEDKGKLRLGTGDPRISIAKMQKSAWEGDNTNSTKNLVDIAQTLPEVQPEGAPAAEVSKYWLETARAIDEKRGVFWPRVDSKAVGKSGASWQIFPNQQIGHAVNNMLCYRARPCGCDPDKCYFEVAVYELYLEGKAPETEWTHADPGAFPRRRTPRLSGVCALSPILRRLSAPCGPVFRRLRSRDRIVRRRSN